MRAFTFVMGATLAGLGALGAMNLTAPEAQTQTLISNTCDSIPIAPLVMYNFNGGTLTGTLHTQMTVYNTGFVTISRVNQPVFPTPGIDTDAATTYVTPQEAKALAKQLAAGGAFKLCDQSLAVADIPLTTLTVMTGRADSKAHTFSYWIGVGDYARVSTTIQNFIQNEFPNF